MISLVALLCVQCGETAYCEINMTDFKRILRKGEEANNPTDPCEMYMCIVSTLNKIID